MKNLFCLNNHRMMRSLLVLLVFVLAGFVFSSSPVAAATCTFTGATDNTFADGSNWTGTGPTCTFPSGPGAADTVIIPAATSALLIGNTTVAGLYATGTVSTVGFDLTVSGITQVDTAGAVTSTFGTLTFTGAASSTGAIRSSSGNMLFGSTFQNNGTYNLGSGTATTTLELTNAGTINLGSGTLALLDNLVNTGSFNAQTSTVKFSSATDQYVDGVLFNNVILEQDGGFSVLLNSSSTVLGALTGRGVSGTLNAQGFPLTLMATTTLDALNTVTSTFGALSFYGPVTSTGAIGSITGVIQFYQILQNNGLINCPRVVGGPLSFYGNTTNTGSIVIPDFGSGSIYPSVVFEANFINSGSLTPVGTITFNNPFNQTITHNGLWGNLYLGKFAGTVTFTASSTVLYTLGIAPYTPILSLGNNALTVVGATTLSGGTVTSTLGTLDFIGAVSSTGAIGSSSGNMSFGSTLQNNGTLDIGSGTATTTDVLTSPGTVNLRTGVLSLLSNFTNTGTLNRGTGTLRFAGTAAQSIASGGSLFNDVVSIKSSGTATLTASSTVLGTLSSTGAGTISSAGNALTVVGTTTLDAGTVTSTSGTLTFTGVASSTGAIGSSFGNISFGSTLRNNGTLDIGSGIATSTGTLTSPGTVNARTGTLVLGSNFTNTGTFNKGTSIVRYTNNTSANVSPLEYYQLQFTGTGTYTLTASTTAAATSTINAGATLSVNSRTFNASGDIVNNGTITETSGTIVHPVDYVRITDVSGTVVPAVSSGDTFYVTLKDQNRNLDGAVAETLTIPVTSDAAAGSDAETLTLTETSVASGVFRNSSAFSVRTATVAAANGYLDLSGSGIGTATYTDNQDSSDTGTTTMTLAYIATPVVSTGGGGGGGSAGGSYILSSPPVSALTAPGTVVTPTPSPALPSVPLPTPSTPSLPATPAITIVFDLHDREALLSGLGLTRDLSAEARARAGVRDDAREFRVTITDAQIEPLALFVAYGASVTTHRLGEGERRALVRDALETMQRADIDASDLDRMTNGQIPMRRNLSAERAQLPRVRQTFHTIFGHDPNFRNLQENLAWNTLMYRIRFPRDLVRERAGIQSFRRIFGRTPATPLQWAAVRVLGYVR